MSKAVCVCVSVSLSNYTLMNKALCCGGVPHFSGFKPEEQTATASPLRPGLNRILMCTGGRGRDRET